MTHQEDWEAVQDLLDKKGTTGEQLAAAKNIADSLKTYMNVRVPLLEFPHKLPNGNTLHLDKYVRIEVDPNQRKAR